MPRSYVTARGVALAAIRAALVAGLASTLGGCYSPNEAKLDYPRDYRERHPIALREGARTVEVFLGRNRGGLSPAQRADVLAFAHSWKREATGGIYIEVPRGTPADKAAGDSLREIHSIFAQSGIPQQAVRVGAYRPAGITITSIRLNYPKLVAEAGPCGQWPNHLGPGDDSSDIENRPYYNFGCSTQRNMASMVDDPADLVQPRGETAAYQARRSVAMDKYRKGENPSGTYTGYDSGKISDLGK